MPTQTCKLCNKVYASKSALTKHQNKKDSCIKSIPQCTTCGKSFSRKANLDKHLNNKNPCVKPQYNNNFMEEIIKSNSLINIVTDVKKIVHADHTLGMYQIGEIGYTNNHIKDMDVFRLFINIIYRNTLNVFNNKLFYHYNDNWVECNNESILIDEVLKRITKLVSDNDIRFNEVINHLTFNQNKKFYINTLKLELAKKINLHMFNKV